MKYQKYIITFVLLITVFLPLLTLAQSAPTCGPEGDGYRLCVPLPGQKEIVLTNLGDYVKFLYQFALAIAGIIAFAVIVYGGIQYTLSAGNITNQKEAVDTITHAVYGLILLLAAVLILYTINPDLIKIGQRVKVGTLINQQNIGVKPLNTPTNFFQGLFSKATEADKTEEEQQIKEMRTQVTLQRIINKDRYEGELIKINTHLAAEKKKDNPNLTLLKQLEADQRDYQEKVDTLDSMLNADPELRKSVEGAFERSKQYEKSIEGWSNDLESLPNYFNN